MKESIRIFTLAVAVLASVLVSLAGFVFGDIRAVIYGFLFLAVGTFAVNSFDATIRKEEDL